VLWPQSKHVGNAAIDEYVQWITDPKGIGRLQSGYYLEGEEMFMLGAELVNYGNEAKEVYVQFDFKYVPAKVEREAVSTLTSVTGEFAPFSYWLHGVRLAEDCFQWAAETATVVFWRSFFLETTGRTVSKAKNSMC
jgi:hypothetical protein